jgi:methyl-accepting chemotaxis protein
MGDPLSLIESSFVPLSPPGRPVGMMTAASPVLQTPLTLRHLRGQASRVFAALLWLHVPLLVWIGAVNHTGVAFVAVASTIAALLGTLVAWRVPESLTARMTIAYALVMMPMLMVHAGSGIWQIDFHMYFFAVYAMLAIYVDWRPIVLAAALTAVHHLVLDFVAPLSVFPDQAGLAGLPRVLMHAFIVIVECSVLFWMTRRVYALFLESDQAAQLAGIEANRANDALAEARQLQADLARESSAKTLALTSTETALNEARSAIYAAQAEEAARMKVEREAFLRDISTRLQRTVGQTVEVLSRSSEEMLESARRAQHVVEDTSRAVVQVKDATQVSSEMIVGVASATGQLSQSSTEIRDRMQHALDVARQASAQAAQCEKSAELLKSAAERVGDVMQVIETVSDQTRLLALNAAIEAARAGDNGRGFAVVAEEVRKLADTASTATRDVVDVVGSMRSASNDVAAAIASIGRSVDSLTDAAANVASAVDEQSTASQQIAGSLRDASSGTDQIRASIDRVATVNGEVSASAETVLRSAHDVAKRSVELRENVSAVLAELVAVS